MCVTPSHHKRGEKWGWSGKENEAFFHRFVHWFPVSNQTRCFAIVWHIKDTLLLFHVSCEEKEKNSSPLPEHIHRAEKQSCRHIAYQIPPLFLFLSPTLTPSLPLPFRFVGYYWWCSGNIPSGLKGPDVVLGIQLGSTMCKAKCPPACCTITPAPHQTPFYCSTLSSE